MATTNINTIIFDLGGVLIDWQPEYVYREIFNGDEEKVKWFLTDICPYSWNQRQDEGYSWEQAVKDRVAEYPQYKEWIEAYYRRWEDMLGGQIQGTVDLLRELKDTKRYRIYALTNWSAETFPIARQHFEFLQWFDGIVVSGEEKTRKPYHDIYQILLNRYSIAPSQAIFIDDNNENVEAGKALGINGIHFKTPDALRRNFVEMGVIGNIEE